MARPSPAAVPVAALVDAVEPLDEADVGPNAGVSLRQIGLQGEALLVGLRLVLHDHVLHELGPIVGQTCFVSSFAPHLGTIPSQWIICYNFSYNKCVYTLPGFRYAMTDTLKVRKVGNSSGVILPKRLLDEMGVEEGDELFAVREADGSLRLTPYDPEFADSVDDAREFMDSHRNAFRELAQ